MSFGRSLILVSLASGLFPWSGSQLSASEPVKTDAASSGGVLYEAELSGPAILLTGPLKLPQSTALVVLDTGCSAELLLDSKLAATFGPRIREISIAGTPAATYRAPDSAFGGLSFPSKELAAVDMSDFRTRLGLPLKGAVGWPALKGKTLVLDYDRNKVQVLEGFRPFPDQQAAAPIEADAEGQPYLKTNLGDREVGFLIDTGSDGSITLLPAEYDRLVQSGWIHDRSQSVQSTDVRGLRTARMGWFIQGSLLGSSLKGMSVGTSELGNAIGLTFLSKFEVALTNTPSSLSYKPRVNPQPPLGADLMMGVIVMYGEGRAMVAKVKPGGAAEKAGLKLQDEILKIDEVEGPDLNCVSLYRLCEKYAGKPVTLHIRREGEEQKVTLTISAPISRWDTQAAVESGS